MNIVAACLTALAVAVASPMPRGSTRLTTAEAPTHSRRTPRLVQHHLDRRAARRPVEPGALATWIDELARSLRSGTTLRACLIASEPHDAAIAATTDPVRAHLRRGATVIAACDAWIDDIATTDREGSELLTTTAAVLAAASGAGGSAAAPLERLAATMRRHASHRLERAATSAQARMSARVLTIVPVAALALLALADTEVRHVVTTSSGALVVGIGLLLNAAGAVWMNRLVRGPR